MNMNDYLDKSRKTLNIESDYALARTIGISRGAISNYRKNKSVFDEFTAFSIAEILEIDPQKVIADIRADYEKDDFKREFWQEKSKEYGYADSSFLMVIMSISVFSVFLISLINNPIFHSMVTDFIYYVK